jgi:hypothetical protein
MVVTNQEYTDTVSFIKKLRIVNGKKVTAITDTETKIVQIQILTSFVILKRRLKILEGRFFNLI